MAVKRTLASKEWLVVTYLSHFSRFIDDPETPPQVTAGGIAQITGYKRSEVDAILKTLSNEGFVRSWSNLIRGEPRKRKVFFLTKDGEKLAMYIMDEAREKMIKIRDDELEVLATKIPHHDAEEKDPVLKGARSMEEKVKEARGKKIRLLSAGKFLDFSPTVLEILMGLEDVKILSLEKVKAAHSRCLLMQPVREWIDFSGHVHRCKTFCGRVHELSMAEDFIESVTQQILVIKGIDGIGKTTLASAIVSMVRGSRHIYWYDFHDHTTLKHLLTSLGLFLSKLKIPTLRNYLAYEDNPDVKEIIHILETSLYDTNTMMVFDDLHKTDDEKIIQFFKDLKDAVEGMMGAKVIVTGRTMPPFYDRRDIEVNGTVTEIPLLGLEKEPGKRLLMVEGVPEEDVPDYLKLTQGHPMYSELLANLGLPSVPKTINFYIETELDNRLKDIEKKLLSVISVYRHPAPSRAFLKRVKKIEDGIDEDPTIQTLETLKQKGLIRADPEEDNFDLHDIIKQHFYDMMMPKVRRSGHRVAAHYYLEEKEDLHRLEVLYHLIMADEHERAGKFAVEKKGVLFRTGYLEDILMLLKRIDRGLLPSDLVLDLSLLEGEILARTEDLEEASRAFRMASKMAGQLGKDLVRANALFNLADVLKRMDMIEEAEQCYMQGLDIVDLEGGPGDLAKAHYGLGVLYCMKGALSEAIEQYEVGLTEARKARDIALASMIATNIGECMLKKGDIAGAMDIFNNNFRMIEVHKDQYLLARAHSIVGLLHFLKEDWDKATTSLQRCTQAAKNLGNSRLLADSLMESAIPFYKMGEIDRADESLEEAEEIYHRLNDKKGLAQVEIKRGELYQLEGNLDASEEAFKSGIRGLERVDDKNELSAAYCSYASLLQERGKKKEAEEFRKKGMSIPTLDSKDGAHQL
jgi:tetratricopeptide (TPR) repeat protein/DNA-binding MarR family transcriptional regulator